MAHIANLPVAAIGAAAKTIVESAEKTGSGEVTGCGAFTNLKEKQLRYMVTRGKQPTNHETLSVVEADKMRDKAVVGLLQAVHSKTYWPEMGVADAAHRMEAVISKLGMDIENRPFNEESNRILNFLTKLGAPELQPDIAALEIYPLISHLAQTQQSFETIQRTRALSSAMVSEITAASNMRRELERAIRGFITYVEAMELVRPSSVWHSLNITIKQQLSEIEIGHRVYKRN